MAPRSSPFYTAHLMQTCCQLLLACIDPYETSLAQSYTLVKDIVQYFFYIIMYSKTLSTQEGAEIWCHLGPSIRNVNASHSPVRGSRMEIYGNLLSL